MTTVNDSWANCYFQLTELTETCTYRNSVFALHASSICELHFTQHRTKNKDYLYIGNRTQLLWAFIWLFWPIVTTLLLLNTITSQQEVTNEHKVYIFLPKSGRKKAKRNQNNFNICSFWISYIYNFVIIICWAFPMCHSTSHIYHVTCFAQQSYIVDIVISILQTWTLWLRAGWVAKLHTVIL